MLRACSLFNILQPFKCSSSVNTSTTKYLHDSDNCIPLCRSYWDAWRRVPFKGPLKNSDENPKDSLARTLIKSEGSENSH